jgi:tetratricopeptide (TPR) repeat protein
MGRLPKTNSNLSDDVPPADSEPPFLPPLTSNKTDAPGRAALRRGVAHALVNKGIALGQAGGSEEEIAVYNEVIGRFGTASEAALREQVATALANKAFTLGQLGRREEAIAVCDDVVGRFGTASEAALLSLVERATKLRARLRSELKKSKGKTRN